MSSGPAADTQLVHGAQLGPEHVRLPAATAISGSKPDFPARGDHPAVGSTARDPSAPSTASR